MFHSSHEKGFGGCQTGEFKKVKSSEGCEKLIAYKKGFGMYEFVEFEGGSNQVKGVK